MSNEVIEDLVLWQEFLQQANIGILINLITFHCPTHIFWADACPQGLGGYSATGRAWRFAIPEEFLPFVEHENNTLEFLASFFCTWIAIVEGAAPPLSCFLSFADSMSALGWLHRANADDQTHPLLQLITRKFARVLMTAECCLYGQHIKGAFNSVSDALS